MYIYFKESPGTCALRLDMFFDTVKKKDYSKIKKNTRRVQPS